MEEFRRELIDWRNSRPKQAIKAQLIVDCLLENRDNHDFSFKKVDIAKWFYEKNNVECDEKTVRRVLKQIAEDKPNLKEPLSCIE